MARRLKPITYLTIPSIMLLASCSADEPGTAAPKEIAFSTTASQLWAGGSASRAADKLAAQPITDIGVYGYANASGSLTIFDNAKATTVGNGASYNTSVTAYWNPLEYRFFAYSPHHDANVATDGASYSSFASFVWRDLPAFTADDLMVGTEIIARDNRSTTGTPADVAFDMRHVYARIRFLFKIGSKYDDMREIHVTKLEVLQAGSTRRIDLRYTPGDPGTLIWTNAVNGPSEAVELHRETPSGAELALSSADATYAAFASVYVYPQLLGAIRFRVTYDVYDSAAYGTDQIKVRSGETVDTTIPLSWGTLKSGSYYDLKINIEPRFIYTITDTDQFDGYIVIK